MARRTAATMIGASCALIACTALQAQPGDEYFEKRVRPLLVEHCSACHGERIQSAGIDFRKAETVIGSAVVSGDESSPLVRALRYESAIKMPPTSKLPEDAIDAIVSWVRMGAPWPGYEPIQAEEGLPEGPVESDHWAFQPLSRPQVPDVGASRWLRNDIDRFVLARLRENGIEPASEAGRLTLLRRVTFDLHGRAPSEGEVRGFAADSGPDPLAGLVERLLASPRYGERWGRHWLDVARYADSTGVDEDHPFGDSWRYRDYVIRSFNSDLPFNRFALEQIAGDLLPSPDGSAINADGIIATGFLAVGPMALAQRDPIQKKYDVVDEQIDTTTKAFLGLTVACARCHDHKFDPILTTDYYALAGIFASTRTFDDWSRNGSRYYKHPLVDMAAHARYQQRLERVRRLEATQRAAKRQAIRRYILDGPGGRLSAYMLAAAGAAPAGGLDGGTVEWFRKYLEPRPNPRHQLAAWRDASLDKREAARAMQHEFLAILEEHVAQFDGWIREALEVAASEPDADLPGSPKGLSSSLLFRDLFEDDGPFDLDPEEVAERFHDSDRARIRSIDRLLAEAREQLPEEPPMANGVTEGDPVLQRVFRRGQHRSPGRLVGKRFPLVLAGTQQPEVSSGSGRLELGRWLASDRNPLTARVIVNRVWLWHFGEGLVRTPGNFGLRGEKPTHPELLDWLASWFIDSGWSVKALHRLVMNSATYRMSSSITAATFEMDPENRLWSRFERRRLTIEEVRDSYLQIGERMDWTVGGDTDLDSGKLAEFDRNNRRIDPDDYARRTVYLPLMRNKLPNLLGLFDFGDATTSGGQRSETNVAPQALYLMNSEFAQRTAALAARSLNGTDPARVDQAYHRILGRPPTTDELETATEFVHRMADQGKAWASLCKMLLASNEFHYIE